MGTVSLHEAVEAELGVDVRELTASELAERSLGLRVEQDRLGVAIARVDAEFESTRAFRHIPGGFATAAQWLAARTNVPAKVAHASYRRARRLMLLPGLQAALIAGLVTMWHANVLLGEASSRDRVRALRDALDSLLAGATGGPREFVHGVKRWAEDHFTAEVDKATRKVEDARGMSVGRVESGMVTGRFGLDPVGGTEFFTMQGRIERELFEADWAKAIAIHGDGTRMEHLARTAEQRRADALVEMARRADAAGSNPSRRPLVTILSGFGGLRDRISELEDGTYLTTDQALRALKVADFERAVKTPENRVEVSAKARLFRGATRRAVEIRDRFCAAPGCEMPPERCDIDHDHRHSEGGLTVQENATMYCPANHDNRRADPETRPPLWEYDEPHWDQLDDDLKRTA